MIYTEKGFYNWDNTLSRLSTADLLMVLGGRSIGKTYGIRLKMVNAFISERQETSCALFRFDKGMKKILSRYFAKHLMKGDIENFDFAVKDNTIFASTPDAIHGAKIDNEPIVYGVALTSSILDKQQTFPNVRYIVFDEAILDRADRFHRYLPNEYEDFLNAFSTIAREEPGNPTRCKAILLGNALDFVNPYFAAFGISNVPKHGYHVYKNGAVVLHYVEPRIGDECETAVSRLSPNNDFSSIVFDNAFSVDSDFVSSRPSNSKYLFGVRLFNDKFGVWECNDRIIVTDEFLENANKLALTTDDAKIDYRFVAKGDQVFRNLMNVVKRGGVGYGSLACKEKFKRVVEFYGIR